MRYNAPHPKALPFHISSRTNASKAKCLGIGHQKTQNATFQPVYLKFLYFQQKNQYAKPKPKLKIQAKR